jgi:hypothetical protein
MAIDPTAAQTTADDTFRGELAKKLTTYALVFVGGIALLTIACAGLDALWNPGEGKTAFFFDVAKYILATTLPVVAGWVGTVLAFYYGRENFDAGTKSVATAAQALTSKEKLATTMVATMGMARSAFNALVLDTTDVNVAKTTDLQKVKEGFKNTKEPEKMYERLPILLKGDVPFMVLHRSTLNAYLVDATDKDPKNSTLANLFATVKYLPNDSFVAVAPDATAALAKTEMEKITNCSDIFVTSDGKKTGAVTRWITNVDLFKASEV